MFIRFYRAVVLSEFLVKPGLRTGCYITTCPSIMSGYFLIRTSTFCPQIARHGKWQISWPLVIFWQILRHFVKPLWLVDEAYLIGSDPGQSSNPK